MEEEREEFGPASRPPIGKPILVEQGVTVYEWLCVTGPHGSDEHNVVGYFIHSMDNSASADRCAGRSKPLELCSASSALANDGVFLLRLCSRMEHAIRIHEARRTCAFMEAARAVSGTVLEPSEYREIAANAVCIEADMQMELWEKALQDCRLFTDAIRRAIQRTVRRN